MDSTSYSTSDCPKLECLNGCGQQVCVGLKRVWPQRFIRAACKDLKWTGGLVDTSCSIWCWENAVGRSCLSWTISAVPDEGCSILTKYVFEHRFKTSPRSARWHTFHSDAPGRLLGGDVKKHKLQATVTGNKKYPSKPCRVCAAHKKRKATRYICSFCNVPLHKGESFERYHTLKHY